MSTRDWGRYLNDSFGALWDINLCGFHGGWGWSEFGTSDDTTPQRHPAVLFQRPNSYYLLFQIWIKEETHHDHDPWIMMIIWGQIWSTCSHDWGNQVVWTSILESFLRSHEKHDTFTMLNMKVGLGCWSLGEGGK